MLSSPGGLLPTLHPDRLLRETAQRNRLLAREIARLRIDEDVRGYIDCDVATARNRLTRMRRKGWIEFAPGSPKRGPNVEHAATDKIDALDGWVGLPPPRPGNTFAVVKKDDEWKVPNLAGLPLE